MGLVNSNFPFAFTDMTMPFSSASRERKSQSVTLAWLMKSYTVFVAPIVPSWRPSSLASLRAMSAALWFLYAATRRRRTRRCPAS